MLVTCHTPGCSNAEQSVELRFTDPDTGDVIVPESYVCGVCGQPITDVRELTAYAADGPQDG